MTKANEIEQIKQLLAVCSLEQKYEIYRFLREEFPIHSIEKDLNVSAEIILEAISRASDLTLRGIRGVIAEAAFEIDVVNKLHDWEPVVLTGNHAYDFLLRDNLGEIRIQVKMQRQKERRPMMASEAYRYLPSTMYVVETQRTRAGQRGGEDTRPYRFGKFDILAVSMHPCTGNWSNFMYTVERWLLPNPNNSTQLLKFQPVSETRNDVWTNDLEECVSWFRSGEMKRII